MKEILLRVSNHRDQFETRATLASRRQERHDHSQIISRISSPLVQLNRAVHPVHNVPFRRNPKFFGQEEALTKLHQQLDTATYDSEPTSSVLHGMGGVGKTQVALEYTYRYRSKYQCIFWLPAEDSSTLSRAVCDIGRQIGLFLPEKSFGQPQVEAVQDWLRGTGKYVSSDFVRIILTTFDR
jgi:hypothetical protein